MFRFFILLFVFYFLVSSNSFADKTQKRVVVPVFDLLLDGDSTPPPPLDFDPYFKDDFESYEVGRQVSTIQPYDLAGRTVIVQKPSSCGSQPSASGSKSAKVEVKAGDTGGGFGKWGLGLNITPNLGKGQEIWVRLKVCWPQSFVFNAFPWMKFMRLHNKLAAPNSNGSTNGGWNDLYVHHADGGTLSDGVTKKVVLRTIKERHDQWKTYNKAPLKRDTWETYEMYLYIDNVSVANGGQARLRIWRDEELIINDEDVETITADDGVIDLFFLFTYWNALQEKILNDNHAYIDDLVIATSVSPPNSKDSSGNVFIGK